MRIQLVTLCTLALLYGGEGRAQGPDRGVPAMDRDAINACLRERTEQPASCIGTVAVPCLGEGSGDRRDKELTCSRREAEVWRERLEVAARVIVQRLAPGQRSRLASVQRSWESYVTEKCAFLGDVQPAIRGPAVHAACELREVALRAIELERLARRPVQTNAPRPELFR